MVKRNGMVKKSFMFFSIAVFSLFILLFIMPGVLGLGLAGAKMGTVTYKPGFYMTNHYSIIGTDKPLEVSADGGILPGISVSEVVNNEFDLIIDFPEDHYVPPGSYSFAITVKEASPLEAGISSQVAVSRNVEVIVYSYEKDIQASLYAPNINQGRNVTFQLGVQSRGYPDIDEVYARINLFNSSRNKVGSVETERKPLPGLESFSFTPSYDTQLFPSGNYYAEALVFYDGKYKIANTTFLIGIMDLILNNYTSTLNPGFNDFEVMVTNGWGNGLRNVYAKLFIAGQEIVQTPSIDLEPWQQGTLKTIINIENDPGTYEARLQLYFESERKDVPIQLVILPLVEPIREVEKEIQAAKVWIFIPALASAIIILVIIGAYLLRKKRSMRSEI